MSTPFIPPVLPSAPSDPTALAPQVIPAIPFNELKISFIGGGNMASALIGGLIGTGMTASHLHVVETNPQSRARLSALGVRVSEVADAALELSDILILAVKPQQMREVATQIKSYLQHQLLISIAAGIRAVDLSRWLNDYGGIVRVMPNTPALIGLGISGMVALEGVTLAQRAHADNVMRAVGQTVWLDNETLIDAVTAISGSGPAYVFYFIEAMQQAGLKLGLTPTQALQLSVATFTGAAQLAASANEPIASLRQNVTSKGGTTYAALTSLEESGVADAIVRAIEAASARSVALGNEFGRD